MALKWSLVFAVYAVGRGADDFNELLQVPTKAVANDGDFFVAHFKIVKQELKDMVDLAKKSNATKQAEAKKAKAGAKVMNSSAGDIRDLPQMVRATNRGLDLLKKCLRQVRKDQKVMLNTTTQATERLFEPVAGKLGFDVKTADLKKLDAVADPLRKVINMYKYGFSRITANEKPLGKKVEEFFSKGAGQSVRQFEEDMIRPVTPRSLEAGLAAILEPLDDATASLKGLSNFTSRNAKAAAFRDVGKKLRALARSSHRGLDHTLTMYDNGKLRHDFDVAKMQAVLVVGPQVMDKAWSVISESMENARARLEIVDNLAALVYEEKPAKQDAKGKKPQEKKEAKGKKMPVEWQRFLELGR